MLNLYFFFVRMTLSTLFVTSPANSKSNSSSLLHESCVSELRCIYPTLVLVYSILGHEVKRTPEKITWWGIDSPSHYLLVDCCRYWFFLFLTEIHFPLWYEINKRSSQLLSPSRDQDLFPSEWGSYEVLSHLRYFCMFTQRHALFFADLPSPNPFANFSLKKFFSACPSELFS